MTPPLSTSDRPEAAGPPSTTAERPVVILPPTRLNLPSPRELWAAREVLYRFGARDIVLRYRQTVVGVLWVVIQPLASAGIFAIVFGAVAGFSSGNVPYIVFSMAGTLAWNLFSGTLSRATPSLTANQGLVSKVYFPRMLVPLSTALSVLIDFAVGLVLLVVMLVVYRVNPGWDILTLPYWVLCAVAMGVGLGLATSALTVKYRDINYALPWFVQIAIYATPVAYALSSVPPHLRWLFNINPLTWLVEGFRFAALGQAAPPAWQTFGLLGAAVVMLCGGALIFQKLERGFADFI